MNEKKKNRKSSSLHLTDKKHPLIAVLALGVGIISALLFIAVCLFSSQSHGEAGILIGAGGLFCLLLSLIGFCVAWYSLHQENIRYFFPTLAVVVNGFLLMFYVFLYIVGTFM